LGTLGYGWPAALGAAVAHPGSRVLAVVGDGGFQYALAELGTAAQHAIPATLLIVDDGGY
jgi:acetolactate synthase-1/2/3 large subunit